MRDLEHELNNLGGDEVVDREEPSEPDFFESGASQDGTDSASDSSEDDAPFS